MAQSTSSSRSEKPAIFSLSAALSASSFRMRFRVWAMFSAAVPDSYLNSTREYPTDFRISLTTSLSLLW